MYSILIMALVIIIDQASKLAVIRNIMATGEIAVIKNFFYITYVENYGIAFGMLKNKTLFSIASTSIISLVVLYYIYKFAKKHLLVTICLSLILGGAIGNLIDRIRLGYVVDFIHFTIFPPVFNLADSAIVLGAIALCAIVLFDKNLQI